MSRVIDALVAYRVLKLLVTPFEKTQAFKFGIIDAKGKVLKKSKQIKDPKERNAYTLLIRFVFNLKRMLSKIGIRGPLGSATAAAIAFFKEEHGDNPEVEKEVYKYLKEQGFEFEISENYGEPLLEGTYKVKHDIYNLDGDIVINIDESVEFNGEVDTIMGYDVFKYNDVYLTTEDLYV
jgi:hypothetical protein|tara:strand:+ start:102 stop:638 length:537 start_codon:yes stop_codon:yes gene_type:complete